MPKRAAISAVALVLVTVEEKLNALNTYSNMNASEKYDLAARAFQIMTGSMAPGKDVPATSHSRSMEERQTMWTNWRMEHGEVIRAMLQAFEEQNET